MRFERELTARGWTVWAWTVCAGFVVALAVAGWVQNLS